MLVDRIGGENLRWWRSHTRAQDARDAGVGGMGFVRPPAAQYEVVQHGSVSFRVLSGLREQRDRL